MARIRTIKPGFFRSLTVTELPKPTRLTWIGLWTYVDDAGRGVDDARLIKAELWPLDDDYPARKVEKDLQLLEANGSIHRYVAEGRKYLAIIEWHHQRIDKPTPSLLPAPTESEPGGIPPDSGRSPGKLQEASVQEKEEGLGREVEVEQGSASSSSKLRVVAEPVEEEEELDVVDQALLAIATAKLDRCLSDPEHKPINDRAGWLAAVIARDRQAFGHQMATMVAGGADVDLLVRTFDRQPPAQAGSTREQLPPAYDEVLVDGEWKLVEQRVGA